MVMNRDLSLTCNRDIIWHGTIRICILEQRFMITSMMFPTSNMNRSGGITRIASAGLLKHHEIHYQKHLNRVIMHFASLRMTGSLVMVPGGGMALQVKAISKSKFQNWL